MSTKIRFGITGSGFMARTHVEAIRWLDSSASLVALWGGSRAPGLAERYGIACEPTVESLVRRDDIDAIVVTTPHHLHLNEVLLALEAGKHVMVEKPMATTVADCDRMLAAAARRKLVIAVGYNLRFRDLPIKARELIAANAIGRVVDMHLTMFMDADLFDRQDFGGANKSKWMKLPENVGFVIDGLPHGVDLMRWFTGAEVKTVAGFSRTFLPGRQVEDTTAGVIEFTNGAVCTVNTSCAVPGPYPGEYSRYSIIGTEGLLAMDPFGELHISNRKDGWRLVATQPKVGFESAETAFGDVRMKAYRAQIQSFIDGIHGQPMQAGSGADGRAGLAACLAMLTSTRERRLVELV